MAKNESLIDIIGKGATGYLKAKTAAKKAQLEMQSKIALKGIEQEMDPMYQIKKTMAEQYQKQMGGGAMQRSGAMPAGRGQMPFGGDTQRYMRTRRPTMKGGKMGFGVPGQRDIYNYLTQKKEAKPKEFDSDDEEMLTALGQKLGFETKEKSITTSDRKLLGEIEALKSRNATPEDIQEHIRFSGYEPDDFAEKLKGYAPTEKKGFWPWQK